MDDNKDYDKIKEKIERLKKYRKILEPIFSKENFAPKQIVSDKLKDIISEEFEDIPKKTLKKILSRFEKEILGVI